MKVLVTGGAGFIGSHLVERLVRDGHEVSVVDNCSTGRFSNLPTALENDCFKFHFSDLSRMLKKRLSLDDYDVIYHLAANANVDISINSPAYDMALNIFDTFGLLQALISTRDKTPKLVNVSSAAVYGNPVKFPISESDPTVPISPYGVSKLAAENYVSVFSQLYGVRAVSARLFSVFGPRQRKQVVYDFFRKLRGNSGDFLIHGTGAQTRDFIYVDDAVSALMIIAEKAPAKGEVYNVGSGYSTSISWLADACMQAAGVFPRIVYTGDVRPGDVLAWEADIRRIKQIGYKTESYIRAGLKTTWEWYNGHPDT
jgi:UDP-glucose 4-epimerase